MLLAVSGIGIGTMLANFQMSGIILLSRTVINIRVRNASPRGPMYIRCLIFSLSGLCELLFLLCFIDSWTRVNYSPPVASIKCDKEV